MFNRGAVIGGLTKIYIAELAEEARLIQIEEYRIEWESNNQVLYIILTN